MKCTMWQMARQLATMVMSTVTALAIVGCGANTPQTPAQAGPPASLVAANQALSAQNADGAIAGAQEYLQDQPNGPYAADAFYIKGSAYKMKPAPSPAESQRNLFEAKTDLLQALQQNPAPALEGDIHTALSNVDYFQDQFADSILEATAAMKLVTSKDLKGSLLFRIGAAEQRMERFTDADQTFRQVEQRYPGTALAESAREHEGMTNFYLQVATFNNMAAAQQAIAALRGNGIDVTQQMDKKGNITLADGPFSQYGEAKKVKDQLQNNFPQAVIVP